MLLHPTTVSLSIAIGLTFVFTVILVICYLCSRKRIVFVLWGDVMLHALLCLFFVWSIGVIVWVFLLLMWIKYYRKQGEKASQKRTPCIPLTKRHAFWGHWAILNLFWVQITNTFTLSTRFPHPIVEWLDLQYFSLLFAGIFSCLLYAARFSNKNNIEFQEYLFNQQVHDTILCYVCGFVLSIFLAVGVQCY